MNKAARTLAAGVAVAALALTGCANSAADAATVGGVRIADSTVRQVAQTLATTSGAEPSLALKQATYDLLLGEAARQVASARGTRITPAEQQAVLAEYPAAAAIAAQPGGEPWADAVTTAFLLQDRMGVEEFVAEVGKLDVTVNPRYGQWDGSRATFADASLSRVVDPSTLRR